MRPLGRVGDLTASGTSSPTRLGVPVPPLDEDLAKYPWMVRHDPVYAEVQEAGHLTWIVDSPHVDLKAPVVGHPEKTAIHDGYAGLADRHLEAQGGRSAGRNAQTGEPEPGDGKWTS